MRTLKLTVAYDGTNYVGWQRQATGDSVQQVLEDAFVPLAGAGEDPPGVAGAGRTDAGVHAAAQVASVNLDTRLAPSTLLRALNVRLPLDVRVLAVEDALPGFHARFHARGKAYRYRLSRAAVLSPFDRAFVMHAAGLRDVDAMRHAASTLVGRHDFASFQASGTAIRDTVRTVSDVGITEDGDVIAVDVEGDGFLRHMVRIMVGTLVEIGCGLRPADAMPAICGAADRRAAGPTAPAHGLTLMAVRY
jgi:tRNA pseudouridine38-40 synthase